MYTLVGGNTLRYVALTLTLVDRNVDRSVSIDVTMTLTLMMSTLMWYLQTTTLTRLGIAVCVASSVRTQRYLITTRSLPEAQRSWLMESSCRQWKNLFVPGSPIKLGTWRRTETDTGPSDRDGLQLSAHEANSY